MSRLSSVVFGARRQARPPSTRRAPPLPSRNGAKIAQNERHEITKATDSLIFVSFCSENLVLNRHVESHHTSGTDLDYEHITMTAWHPERKEAVRFLKIATDPENKPVLVHCLHGADRTGAMCALYRIAVQGWTKEEAGMETEMGSDAEQSPGKAPRDYDS